MAISQTLGRNDLAGARHAAKQLTVVVFLLATVVAVVAISFRQPLLKLIFGAVDKDVMSNALVYLLFTAMSYPFPALYNSRAAIFRSMGNSGISMMASLLMNLINVTGNAILIFKFHMGAAGAAIATLISRIVGAILIQGLLRNKKNTVYVRDILKFRPDFHILRRICSS